MYKGAVVGAKLQAELAHRFEEGQGLNVAHRATNFNNGHVHGLRGAKTGTTFDEVLISLVTWGMTCTVLPR